MMQCVADGSEVHNILSLWILQRRGDDDDLCRPRCGHDGAGLMGWHGSCRACYYK